MFFEFLNNDKKMAVDFNDRDDWGKLNFVTKWILSFHLISKILDLPIII